MLKILICFFLFLGSFLSLAQTTTSVPSVVGAVSVSGTPRIIRSNQVNGTEIFFSDSNKSYFIPVDSQHNSKYEIFSKAIAAKKSVGFVADPISRRILSVDGAAPAKSNDSAVEPEVEESTPETKNPKPTR